MTLTLEMLPKISFLLLRIPRLRPQSPMQHSYKTWWWSKLTSRKRHGRHSRREVDIIWLHWRN